MKKLLIIIFFLPVLVIAQKQDYNWVISDSLLISFNSGNPTISECGIANTIENNSCISDKNGNLQFYNEQYPITVGNCFNYFMRLKNNFGNTIINGDSLYNFYSSTQGSLFLASPSDTGKYYFIQLQNRDLPQFSVSANVYYSVIDKDFNFGEGRVISKNNILYTGKVCEKVQAVRHANGRDWWILMHDINSNNFIEFLLNQNGLNGPIIQSIGQNCDSTQLYGVMKFNRSGNKLAFIEISGIIDYYNFDRCNGILSLISTIDTGIVGSVPPPSKYYYGCEFSPNDKYLYITAHLSSPNYLFQFDLTAPDIYSSKIVVLINPSAPLFMSQMLLAPDNKIYVLRSSIANSNNLIKYIGCINNPDSLGMLCNFDTVALITGTHKLMFAMPNIPNYRLSAIDGSPCDTLGLGVKENTITTYQMQVYPNPANNEVSILFAQNIKQGVVTITDITGRFVTSAAIKQTNSVTFNVAMLPAGVYIVTLQTKEGREMKKFVKE